jgi:hypothetical protein
MTKNTKFLLRAGAIILILVAIIVTAILAVSPLFNIANIVSGDGR